MKDYLVSIVQPLLTEPESLVIVESKDDMGVLLTMRVAKKDMGIAIGREGQTARAIRTLLHSLGASRQARISVKILEPDGTDYQPSL